MSDKAQIDESDELGWALDKLAEYARIDRMSHLSLCPKATVRAHARLLRERNESAQLRAELEQANARLAELREVIKEGEGVCECLSLSCDHYEKLAKQREEERDALRAEVAMLRRDAVRPWYHWGDAMKVELCPGTNKVKSLRVGEFVLESRDQESAPEYVTDMIKETESNEG